MRPLTRRELLLGTASATVMATGWLTRPLPATPLRRRVQFGAYAANEPWPSLEPHLALEQQLGARLPTMSWFQSWDNDWLHAQARQAAGAGDRPLLIAWEPRHDDGRPVPLHQVTEGKWDRHLTRFLEGARSYLGPVTIRLAHEMNGTWYPWSGNPEHYIAMWRHVVRLGRQVAPNVRWMWCVSASDAGIPAEAYWPGRDWVDVLGLDGYNGFGPWTSFEQLFTPMHDRLALLTDLPQEVAEVSSAEGPGKAQWMQDLFACRGLPAVRRVVFFHADKEHDWRLDSTPAVLAAVRAGLSEAGQA